MYQNTVKIWFIPEMLLKIIRIDNIFWINKKITKQKLANLLFLLLFFFLHRNIEVKSHWKNFFLKLQKYLEKIYLQNYTMFQYSTSCQLGLHPHNRPTCWLWVATHNAWGQNPGCWPVCDLGAKCNTLLWPLLGLDSQSDQSAGHVKP